MTTKVRQMTNTSKTSYSNSRALWQVLLLYITTCGLYFFYWFYKANQRLYVTQQNAIKPFWRTLGLLVPILNVYLLWKLFNDIKKFAAEAGVASYPYPGLLTLVFLACSALYRLPGLFSFAGFSSVLPILIVQHTLNRYWKKEQPALPIQTQLAWPEIAICVLGSILLILATIGAGLHTGQD